MLGFPIRKSSDLSSVDSSPRLIAASYVLHRLLVPRHPPCALTNLATKMLASTVQFSRYGRTQPTRHRLPTPAPKRTDADGSATGLTRRRHQTKKRLILQDPTAHLRPTTARSCPFRLPPPAKKQRSERLNQEPQLYWTQQRTSRTELVSVPPMSSTTERSSMKWAWTKNPRKVNTVHISRGWPVAP